MPFLRYQSVFNVAQCGLCPRPAIDRQRLLAAARQHGYQMVGTQEAVPVDVLQYIPVTVGQPESWNIGRAFETGETNGSHASSLAQPMGQGSGGGEESAVGLALEPMVTPEHRPVIQIGSRRESWQAFAAALAQSGQRSRGNAGGEPD